MSRRTSPRQPVCDELEALRRRVRECEQTLQLALDVADLGLWDWDIEAGAVTFDGHGAAGQAYAPPESESTPHRWESLIHPDDWPGVQEKLEAYVAGAKDTYQAEYRLRHKAGTWVHMQAAGRATECDSRGRPRHVRGVHRALSRDRAGDEPPGESERRYRELFERTSSGVAVYQAVDDGRDFVIVDLNPAAGRIEQTTNESVIGRRVTEAFPGVADSGLLEVLRQVWRTGEPAQHPTALYQESRVAGWRENSVYRLPCGDVVVVCDDVTARKQAEEAAREERNFSESAIEAMPGVFFMFDERGRFVKWNRNLETLSGYAGDEIAQRTIFDLLRPDCWELVKERVQEVFSKGSAVAEVVLVSKDGRETPFYCNGRRIVLDGQLYVLGMAIDISERKEAEESLRRNRNMMGHILNSIPQSVFWKDRDGAFLGCNDVFARAAGIDHPAQIVGKTDYDLPWPRGEADAYRSDDRQVIEQNCAKRHIIEPLQQADGTRVWIDTSKVPLCDEDGAVYGILGVFEDVTDRKRAEEDLRESEERYRSLFEAANDAIFLLCGDRFVDCNPRSLAMFGCSRSQILQSPPYELSPEFQPDGHPSRDKALEKISAAYDGEPQFFEWRHRRADGSPFEAEVSLSRMSIGNKPHLLAIIRDISDRKRAEDALRASEQRYRNFVANATEGIYRIDLTEPIPIDLPPEEGAARINRCAIVGEVNEALARMYGLRAADMLGRPATDFAPEYGKRAALVLGRENYQVADEETLDRRADGRPLYLSENYTGVVEHGQLVRIWGVQRDVTERRRAEDAIAEGKRLSDAIIDSIPGVFYVYDEQGDLVRWNTNLETVTGYSAEEIRAMKALDFVAEADVTIASEAIRKVFDTGYAIVVARLQTRDGRKIPFLLSGFATTIQEKRVLVGAGIDVTERVKAEEALRDSEQRFRTLVTQAADAFYLHDENGWILDVNQKACESLGYTRTELLAMNAASVDVEIESRHHKERFWNTLRPGEPATFEGLHRRKDGSTFPVEVRLGVLELSGRRLMLGLVRDITERKRTEETLIRICKSVECASDAIGMSDAQGHHFYQNKAFTDLFEYQPDEITVTHGEPVVYVDKSVARDVFATTMGGGSWSGEVEMTSKSGRRFPVRLRADAIKDEQGNVIGLVGAHTDITERKRAEEQQRLRQTELRRQNELLLQLMMRGTLFEEELNAALAEITTTGAELLQTERVSVWWYEDDYQVLRCADVYRRSTREHASGETLRSADFPSYNASHRKGHVIVAVDVRTDPRTCELPAAYWDAHDIRSLMDAPVWLHGQLGAVVCFEHVGSQRQWTSDDEGVATTLATLVSLCVESAERRRSEMALRESEARLTLALDVQGAGCWELDVPGNRVIADQRLRDSLGFSPGEGLETPEQWQALAHPEDDARVRASFRAHLNGETPVYEVEMRSRHCDGHYVWWSVRGRVIERDQAGRALRMIGTCTDISERKRAETALREQAEQYAALLTTTLDGLCLVDGVAHLLDVNAAYCRMTGYSRDELLHMTISDLDADQHRDQIAANLREIARTGSALFASRHRAKDGRIIDVEVSATHLPSKGWFIVFVRDITQRRRQEEWIRRLNSVKEDLLKPDTLAGKLRLITDAAVNVFAADFARVWIVRPGDLCEAGCLHARPEEGPHACRDRGQCLHLMASSGRYTHLDGEKHRRVPLGSYKIGRIAAGEDAKFLTNDVVHDPRVHDHEWARQLGLTAFAGYRLTSPDGKPAGVLALFSQSAISPEEDALLETLANTASQVMLAAKAEEALRESEERFRQLAENTPEVLWLGTPAWDKILYLSPTYDRVWGRPREEALRNAWSWMDAVVPEDRPAIRAVIESRSSQDASLMVFPEYRITRPDGEIRWIAARAFPVRDDAGRIHRIAGIAEDITDRKRAEEALRLSEATYRSIFNTVRDAIWVHDLETREFTDVNDSVTRLFGYSVEEVKALNVEDISSGVHPFTQETAVELLNKASAGQPQLFEWHCRHKDGHLFWSEVQLCRGTIAGKECILAIERDITERKQAEIELLREKEFTDKLLESLPGIFFLYDSTCHLKRWNKAHETATGFTADELRDWYIPDWHETPEDAAVGMALVKQILETGVVGSFETTLINKEGLFVPYLISITRLMTPDGPFMMGVGLDITERKRIEEERGRLTAVLDSTSDVVAMNHPAGGLFYLNAAGRRVLEWDETAALDSHDLSELYPAWAYNLLRDEAMPVVNQTGFWQGETAILGAGGREIPVSQLLMAHRATDGHVEYYSSIMRDITERKRAEEARARLEAQLHQSQKMEAIGQLAGGIAHDFNNILTAVFGQLDLALQTLESQYPSASDLLEGLHQIERSADRASALTRQLLAFSRRQVIRPEVLNLNATLRDFEKMLRRLLTENITLEQHLAPDLAAIKADAGQLEQVIMNLVVNARDAMPNGGHLTLETRNVVLESSYVALHPGAQPGEHVVLAVSDTGHGMDAATLQRIFEPFFTTKSKGQGTGLGLSTVYGIVKQAGGHVDVYSEPGRGTTFKVYLPAVHEPVAIAKSERAETALPRGTETLMICEDDQPVRELTARMLTGAGYKVLVAASPTRALKLAAEHAGPLELLITDVIMPDMNGRQLADALLKLRPQVRTLFVSGYTENLIAHHGVLDEGVDFLEKPYSRHALLVRIRELLDRPSAAGACPPGHESD